MLIEDVLASSIRFCLGIVKVNPREVINKVTHYFWLHKQIQNQVPEQAFVYCSAGE
jgi:hypothetical protein